MRKFAHLRHEQILQGRMREVANNVASEGGRVGSLKAETKSLHRLQLSVDDDVQATVEVVLPRRARPLLRTNLVRFRWRTWLAGTAHPASVKSPD